LFVLVAFTTISAQPLPSWMLIRGCCNQRSDICSEHLWRSKRGTIFTPDADRSCLGNRPYFLCWLFHTFYGWSGYLAFICNCTRDGCP